jgi:hypothetical protein
MASAQPTYRPVRRQPAQRPAFQDGQLLVAVFGLALFSSALLLFLVQPLVGRLVTPLLGGSPAVWITCMVFFQAVLLAGYVYAHATSAWLGSTRQALLHLFVLLLPLAFLPLAVDPALAVGGESNPIAAVLWILATSVGVPFFVVSASAPLLQRWFASTGHSAARDPYFLYSASNLGSMLALLAYPFVVEPCWSLATQRRAWSVAYGLVALLVGLCGLLVWKAARSEGTSRRPRDVHDERQPITWRQRWRWLALGAVPTSLMLGVTSYITTDIAPMPLLWAAPLTLYLLSFVVTFARRPLVPHAWIVRSLPPLVLALLFLLITEYSMARYIKLAVAFHLLVFFVCALCCHGELAAARPGPRHLTEYFLLMATGGVLGGAFNAVAAPFLFNSLAEYPLALLAACALVLPCTGKSLDRRYTLAHAGLVLVLSAIALLCAALAIQGQPVFFEQFYVTRLSLFEAITVFGLAFAGWHMLRNERRTVSEYVDVVLPLGVGLLAATLLFLLRHLSSFGPGPFMRYAVGFGIPAVLCYPLVSRPPRFVLAVCGLLLGAIVGVSVTSHPSLVVQRRSFFGVLRVLGVPRDGADGTTVVSVELTHGTTVHGRQFRDFTDDVRDREQRSQPLSYYHRAGPLGQVFAAYNLASDRPVAVIGLGTGSIAAYSLPGQRLDFFEIDPLVQEWSFGDGAFFTFVEDARARGADVNLALGDARLVLERQPSSEASTYGILVVDAFSSDALPIHLLNQQALALYLRRLRDDGIICFNISNRYLDLEPVLANLAKAEHLAGYVLEDIDSAAGKETSRWVVLARKREHVERLLTAEGNLSASGVRSSRSWHPLRPRADVGLWTDDYSNLLSVFSR